jgi:hypothetical protein
MITNNEKPRWLLYPTWIILTSLCVPIAFFLDLVILRIIISFVGEFIYVDGVRHITEDFLSIYPFIPIMGLLTGGIQYGLLRRYLPRMGGWVLATIGGWILGALLIARPFWLNWADGSLNLDLAFLLMGFAIGLGQWPLLRRHLPRASCWIGANLAGWGLLALITTRNSLDQFGLFTLGSLPACVTAAMLAVLMNQVKPTQPK